MRRLHTRSWFHVLRVAVLPLLLAGCITGPDYKRPSLNVPNAYKSAMAGEETQPTLGQDWWLIFQDPELDALMKEALKANQDLKAAMARVAQSRASTASVRSSFFPVVTMNPSATRSGTPGADASSGSTDKLSEAASTLSQVAGIIRQVNALSSGTATSGTTGSSMQTSASNASVETTSDSFRVPFDLSYEIDIWGKLRRSYEAAKAQMQASVCDLEVVRQTLLADLAQNYFTARSLDAQDQIISRNMALYEEQADLTQKQFKAGLAGETNYLQAKVQLESTRAQLVDVRRQRADLEHAIAILLGRPPVEFTLEVRPLDLSPPVVPAGLPSDLLKRRPDVAEAEQNLMAACAEIGVAKAEFFPSLKLTGSAGFQSAEFKDALDWRNRVWSIGPSISLPIFEGGKLRANLRKAKARYDELLAVYRGTVLAAFGDVEDSLTDLHMRADVAEAEASAVAAAREYLRLTQIRYQTGTVDYLNMIDAEKSLLSNELSEIQTLNQRMISTVLLVKALGGGWESPGPVQAKGCTVPGGQAKNE